MSDKFTRVAWAELEEVAGTIPGLRPRQRLRALLRRVLRSRAQALRRLRTDPARRDAMPEEMVAEVRREAVARWGEDVAELEHRQQATDGALECVRQYARACARRGTEAAGVCAVVNDLLARPHVAAAASVADGERDVRHENRVLAVRVRWLADETRRLAGENQLLTTENKWLTEANRWLSETNQWLLES